MDRSLNAIIITTIANRQKIVDALGELIPYQVKIVSTLDEVKHADWERYKNLILLEDIVKTKEFLVELQVYLDIYEKQVFYIGSDSVWINALRGIAKTHQLDYLDLSYKMLEAVIYDDQVLLADHVKNMAPFIEEIAEDTIQQGSKDVDKIFLAEEYLAMRALNKQYDVKNQELQDNVKDLNRRVMFNQDEARTYKTAYRNLFSKVEDLNRFTTQLSTISVKDVYDKIDVGRFPNKPFILYLKEWQELLYLEEFIQTLHGAFSYHLRLATQVVRLMDSVDSKRILTVPDIYDRVGETFTIQDVYTSSYIVRLGEYEKLLEMLLSNNNHVIDVLIVVDQKAHSDVVLSGNYVYMNMCRNSKHLSTFNISPSNTIVNNNSKCKFTLNTVDELRDVKTPEEKFLLLSNQPVVQNILDLYRGMSS